MSEAFMYPASRYRLKILSAALGESKPKPDGTTTQQIELGVKVLGEYQGGELLPCNGPTRLVFLSLTEGTLGTAAAPGWVAQTLADLGFRGPSFADLEPLLGKERDGECKHDDYGGETKEKWSVYRDSRAPMRPASEGSRKQLDAQHKDLLKALARQAAGTPAAPARPQTPARPAARPGRSSALPDKTAADFDPPEANGPTTSKPGDEIPF